MKRPGEPSRRERQIMEVIYARRAATVADVRADLRDPPSYSAVRATMTIMVRKGWLRHTEERGKFIYTPTVPRGRAAQGALRRFLSAYFDDSVENAVASLLSVGKGRLTREEYDRLLALIQRAREGET